LNSVCRPVSRTPWETTDLDALNGFKTFHVDHGHVARHTIGGEEQAFVTVEGHVPDAPANKDIVSHFIGFRINNRDVICRPKRNKDVLAVPGHFKADRLDTIRMDALDFEFDLGLFLLVFTVKDGDRAANFRAYPQLGSVVGELGMAWALIDNGRRLLFMTNYSGAWDSYLNEFSELASVIGVNLIWTNTYIAPKRPEHKAGIYFPETALFTGKGARATLPFKAYVRQSQLETLVWYGAYRDLSVVNVIDNSKIRKAVFGPPDAASLDLLLKRL